MRRHPKAPSAPTANATGKGANARRARLPLAFLGALVAAITVALGAAAAIADAPPAVTIGSPSAISYTGAHVVGTANPQGGPSATSWHFEYTTDPVAGSWEFAYSASGEISGTDAEGTSPIAVGGDLEGLEPDTTYSVRLVAENEGGANQVMTTAPYPTVTTLAVTPPSVSIDPADGITPRSAELSGEVDPEGSGEAFNTSWEFQCTPACPAFAGGYISADGSSRPVEATVGGLQPNLDYEVTLVAENRGGSVSAGPITFKTAAAPPDAFTLYAFPLEGGTEAMLGARINANNQPTTYWFEYGTDDSYGASLPVGEDGSAGSGGAVVYPTQKLTGLAPEATYHYRVVAKNATGQVVGADRTFTTRSDAVPPQETCGNAEIRAIQGSDVTTDCRAWEMVSPLDKNNLDAGGSEVSPSPVAPSVDGNQAILFTDGAFGDAESGSTGDGHLSVRSAGGWTTHGLQPPLEVTSAFGNRASFEKFISPDLSRSLMASPSPLTPDSPAGVPNLYVRNNVTNEYELVTITPPTNAPAAFVASPFVAGVSSDFKRVVFYSTYQYTPDAPDTSGYLLYEWRSGDPQLQLVGELPDESTPPVFIGGQSNSAVNGSRHRAVSADGSRIYFNAPSTGGTYLREGGETKEVSPSGEFWTASPDGSKALLIAGGQLKLYDATAETLTDLVTDAEPSDGSDPEVYGLLGTSDDLSVIYFSAGGKLVPGGEDFEWSLGHAGLYVYDDGEIRQLGTVGRSTDNEGAEIANENGLAFDAGYPFDGNRATTPDGRLLVFASARRLTAYDNASRSEIYAYDNETGELTCISCRADGTPPTGNAVLEGAPSASSALVSITLENDRRGISTGAARIFFTTTDAVSSDDTNGTPDVYVWEDGRADLVTPGVGDDREGYIFKAADPSGDNVFFSTRNRLVGIDTDDLGDIYSSRVGGGIASQLAIAAVAPCEGDQCRSASAPPPAASSPPSREVRGAKNATPKKQKHKKQKQKKKKHKKKQQKKSKGKSKAGKHAQGNG